CWCCRCRLRLRRLPPKARRAPRHNRCGRRCRRRSATAPMSCSCSVSSPAVSNSPSSPSTCRATSSTAALRRKSAPGPSRRSGCSTSSGSLASGWLGNLMPKRYILSFIYFARAAAVLAFISFPVTPLSSILFGAVMGLLWLSTVAPTNGIIALIFGTRWLATLAGLAFFSHQVGGFLGVWLGGIVFVRTGSYDAVWWLSVLFGVLSAVVNLPIVEKPVVRAAAAPA